MGHLEDVVPAYFRAEEDVTRESTAVIPDAERGADRSLGKLQEIWDQLTSIGATADQGLMERTALNAISKEWKTFVQSILGKANLPD